jgi:hypothetical protein
MAALLELTSPGFPFKASAGWGQDFRKEHQIRQTHMSKYISSTDNMTFEETVKAAKLLQK